MLRRAAPPARRGKAGVGTHTDHTERSGEGEGSAVEAASEGGSETNKSARDGSPLLLDLLAHAPYPSKSVRPLRTYVDQLFTCITVSSYAQPKQQDDTRGG